MKVVVDTSVLEDFLDTSDQVIAGHQTPELAWLQYERRHRKVFDRYHSGWGNPSERSEATAQMTVTAARIRIEAIDWVGVLQESAARLAPHFPGIEVHAMVMVGYGTSNGWTTTMNGRHHLFLAAEVAPQGAGVGMLAAHELFHLGHAAFADPCWHALDAVSLGAAVFIEGLATYASALAWPGHPDSQYLWFGEEPSGWLEHCRGASTISLELVSDLAETEESIQGRYLRTTGAGHGDPPRFGYYAGLEAVRRLASGNPVSEMLRWGPDRVFNEMCGALNR